MMERQGERLAAIFKRVVEGQGYEDVKGERKVNYTSWSNEREKSEVAVNVV